MLQQFGYIEKAKGQWQNEVTVQKTEGQVSDITERDIEELEEQNTEHIREEKVSHEKPMPGGIIMSIKNSVMKWYLCYLMCSVKRSASQFKTS